MGNRYPLQDMLQRYFTSAFSSCGVRYCYYIAYSWIDALLWWWCHSVVNGTLVDLDSSLYFTFLEPMHYCSALAARSISDAEEIEEEEE